MKAIPKTTEYLGSCFFSSSLLSLPTSLYFLIYESVAFSNLSSISSMCLYANSFSSNLPCVIASLNDDLNDFDGLIILMILLNSYSIVEPVVNDIVTIIS